MAGGFKLYKYVGEHPPIEYKLMTNSEACTIGQRLRVSSGRLTLAASTLTCDGIALKTVAAATAASVLVPYIEVRQSDEFVAYASTAVCLAATDIGTFFDCSTDGLSVLAVSSGASFKVTNVDGTTALNNKVYGKFVPRES